MPAPHQPARHEQWQRQRPATLRVPGLFNALSTTQLAHLRFEPNGCTTKP